MDIITTVFVFVLIWWLVIFTVLPWGNAAHEKPEVGHAASAPANPRILKKLLWTTIISVLITAALSLTVYLTGFSLHHWVKSWADSA